MVTSEDNVNAGWIVREEPAPAVDSVGPHDRLRAPDDPPYDVPPRFEISAETLNRFARAWQRVQALRLQLERDLATARTPVEANRMQAEAQEQIAASVRRQGLTLPDYARLSERVESDPALRRRVTSRFAVEQR
jgi:hypothetical protein